MKQFRRSQRFALVALALGLSGCGGSGNPPPFSGPDPTTIVPMAQINALTGTTLGILLPNRTGVRTGNVTLLNLQPGDQNSTLGMFQTKGGLLVSNGCSGGPIGLGGSIAFAVREAVLNTIPGEEPGKFLAIPVDMTNQEATAFINGTYLPAASRTSVESLVSVRVPRGMGAKLMKWMARFKTSAQYQFIEVPGSQNFHLAHSARDGRPPLPASISGRGYTGFLSADAYFGATLIMRQPGQTQYLLATGHSIAGYGPVSIPVSFADCVVLTDGSIDPTPTGSPFGTMIGDLRYGSVLDSLQDAQVTPVVLTVNGAQVDTRWIAQLNGANDEFTYNYEEMDLMVDNYFKSLTNLQGTATVHVHGETRGGQVFDMSQNVDTSTDQVDLNTDIQGVVSQLVFQETTMLRGDDLVVSTLDLTIPAAG